MNTNQKTDQKSAGTATGQKQNDGTQNQNRPAKSNNDDDNSTDVVDEEQEMEEERTEQQTPGREHDDMNHQHDYKTPKGEQARTDANQNNSRSTSQNQESRTDKNQGASSGQGTTGNQSSAKGGNQNR